MTAIEDARAALEDWGLAPGIADVVRALIAEHDRVAAPPTDDEREALRTVIDKALYEYVGDTFSDAVLDKFTEHVLRAVESAGFRRQGPITDEWEYRATVCEPDTGDVYDSTRACDTAEEATQTAENWGLLDSTPDLPQLVLGVERRRKAGPWEPVEAAERAR